MRWIQEGSATCWRWQHKGLSKRWVVSVYGDFSWRVHYVAEFTHKRYSYSEGGHAKSLDLAKLAAKTAYKRMFNMVEDRGLQT